MPRRENRSRPVVTFAGEDGSRAGRSTAFQTINPCQEFRDGDIELRRDALIQVDLHEQGDQLGRFVHIHPVLLRPRDDLLGDESFALGHDARCRVGLGVSQGDSAF